MVPVPTPPTDNFYKFVAICAVVLLVASLGTAYFEIKMIAEANLLEQRSVDDQSAKLEMWVFDAKDDGEKQLRQEYATKRTAKLIVESEARKKTYVAAVERAGSWWGTVVGISILFAIAGLCLWFFRVQKLQDEIQSLEKRLLAAQVIRAEFDNRDIAKDRTGPAPSVV